MSVVRNPSVALITCANAVRDGVVDFRLKAKIVDTVKANVIVPKPSGSGPVYTVSLDSLKAAIAPSDQGQEMALVVSAIDGNGGESPATVDPDTFIYQPFPDAPSSVAFG